MAKRRKRRLKKKFKVLLFIIVAFIIFYYAFPSLKVNKNIKENIDKIINSNKVQDKTVRLSLIGDIMFEQPYLDALDNGEDVNNYLKLVNDKYFTKDDVTIGNLELTITDGDLEVSAQNYTFCVPQSIGYMLGNNSIEVLGTTNNHSADRGIQGIDSTLDFIYNNTNILPVGTYRTKEERKQVKIVEKNGVKIGFVAYAMGTNKYVSPDNRWKLGLFRDMSLDPFEITDEMLETMEKEINEVRSQCDVLVAIMHWGQEHQYNERADQRQLAKFLNEHNVDIVLGSHSHCYQPVEWYTSDTGYKTLVFYSLGNFTSADPILEGINDDYRNAYNLALVADIEIKIEDNKINYTSIKTEPIINYFDKNERNYLMIPLSEYTEEYEKSHYLYKSGLNKEYIKKTYNKVIPEEFRQ